MEAFELSVRCPAKVNLMLRVLGRRDDGYHEIRTVFQAIDLWDTVRARPARDLTLECDDLTLPTDESNLVLRAASLLRGRAALHDLGAKLTLEKTIPAMGGLGGGSSDAAGTLLLLSRLWDVPSATVDLESLAAEIGADVPFFLRGGTALGDGRGDRITSLPFLGGRPILVGFPPWGTSTARTYERFDGLTPEPNHVSVNRFSTCKLVPGNDLALGINDLERVVFEDWPESRRFRDELLRHGATAALLSGSGSSIFGVFDEAGLLRDSLGPLRASFERWRLLETRAIPGGPRVSAAGWTQ